MALKTQKERTIKFLLALPATLLDPIDRYAEKAEVSRTEYLRDVLAAHVLHQRELDEQAVVKEKEARKTLRK